MLAFEPTSEGHSLSAGDNSGHCYDIQRPARPGPTMFARFDRPGFTCLILIMLLVLFTLITLQGRDGILLILTVWRRFALYLSSLLCVRVDYKPIKGSWLCADDIRTCSEE
jgi:hypothetical protein